MKNHFLRAFFKVSWQILLAIIICVAALLITKYTVMALVHSLVEVTEIQGHAVNGLASLFAFSVGYVIYVKFYEKRNATELNFSGRNFSYGAIAGAAIISITISLLFALDNYQVVTYQPLDDVFFALIGLSAQAISGTILFTAIFFRLIEKHIGTRYSLLSLPILLGLVNITVDGPNLVVLLSSALISALWFSIYVLSRNIWVVGLANGTWLCSVFAIGVLDEHWRASAPITTSYSGSVLLTGGEFGPEHSIITILVVSICVFLILRLARKKKLFVKI